MSIQRSLAYALLGASLFLLRPCLTAAYPVDMDKLPNQGRNSFGCIVCHISPAGEEINIFGKDYRDNDHQYDEKLQRMDSDRDGYSNDQELRSQPSSNPGDARSYPASAPNPWAWAATTGAVVVLLTGVFSYVLQRSSHPS